MKLKFSELNSGHFASNHSLRITVAMLHWNRILSPFQSRSMKSCLKIIYQCNTQLVTKCTNRATKTTLKRYVTQGFHFDKAKIVSDWESGVQESKLKDCNRKIHKAHLNAVQVCLSISSKLVTLH